MKIGFIGTGNMAQAMIGGIIKKGQVTTDQIIGSDVSDICLEQVQRDYHIQVTQDNDRVVHESDVLFLSIKPQYYEQVIHQIRDKVREEQLIVSIAPGKTISWLEEQFGKACKIIRTMPNTPALVGEGMTGVCVHDSVLKEELEIVLSLLRSFGKAEVVYEQLMDAVVSVSGSSPAYVFVLIEAMADAAVAEGMPRDLAYEFVTQAIYGSAKMVMETGRHPGELKDMVCSPGGTTIEGVQVLEETGFRSSVMQAMRVVAEKSRNM